MSSRKPWRCICGAHDDGHWCPEVREMVRAARDPAEPLEVLDEVTDPLAPAVARLVAPLTALDAIGLVNVVGRANLYLRDPEASAPDNARSVRTAAGSVLRARSSAAALGWRRNG